MKKPPILNQLNFSSLVFICMGIFCCYASFSHITSESNKFFYILGGATTVILGFATVLNILNIFMMPRDKFYTKMSWMNHVGSLVLLMVAITIPEELIIATLLIFVFSIMNIILFVKTLSFRSNNSIRVNELRKLFPDKKSFRFDLDFSFRNEIKKTTLDMFNSGIGVFVPAGVIVFLGSSFYIDGTSYATYQFVETLKEAGSDFDTMTPEVIKTLEMNAY
jgi:hypothetical protein